MPFANRACRSSPRALSAYFSKIKLGRGARSESSLDFANAVEWRNVGESGVLTTPGTPRSRRHAATGIFAAAHGHDISYMRKGRPGANTFVVFWRFLK